MEKPVVKTGEMLFMDIESLKNMPFKLFSQNEENKFINLFSEIPTKMTKDVRVHIENVKNAWKDRDLLYSLLSYLNIRQRELYSSMPLHILSSYFLILDFL